MDPLTLALVVAAGVVLGTLALAIAAILALVVFASIANAVHRRSRRTIRKEPRQ